MGWAYHSNIYSIQSLFEIFITYAQLGNSFLSSFKFSTEDLFQSNVPGKSICGFIPLFFFFSGIVVWVLLHSFYLVLVAVKLLFAGVLLVFTSFWKLSSLLLSQHHWNTFISCPCNLPSCTCSICTLKHQFPFLLLQSFSPSHKSSSKASLRTLTNENHGFFHKYQVLK